MNVGWAPGGLREQLRGVPLLVGSVVLKVLVLKEKLMFSGQAGRWARQGPLVEAAEQQRAVRVEEGEFCQQEQRCRRWTYVRV